MKDIQRLSPEQRARLERLGERGVLTREQVAAVLEELDAGPGATRGADTGLWEVVGYIGGALVLGGVSLLVSMSWVDLSRPSRVGLMVVASLVLAGVGVIIAGGPRGVRALADGRSSPRGRIVAVLFALAACTASMAVGSAVEVPGSPGVATLTATATGLLVALLAYAAIRRLPVLLATIGFSVGVVLAATEEWFDGSTPSVTVGLVALGAGWTALAVTGALRHRHVVLGAGVLIALTGAQCPVGSEQPSWAYGLTLLIALLCFGAYLTERAPVLLALGVLGVTVAVPEAVWHWSRGTLSGPLAVLLVGVVFVVAGGIGFRLRRNR